MGLDREIEALRRRVQKIAKVENPPELKMHIYNEGEKNPTSGSQWELSIMVEKKRPLIGD